MIRELLNFIVAMRAPLASIKALLFVSHLALTARANTADNNSDRPPPFSESIDDGSQGYYPIFTFATEPDVIAPKTNWLQWDPQCDDGSLYFITPRGWGIARPGPMILDWQGNMVWTKHFANAYGGQAYDFKLQQYQGQEYLTFWTGDDRVRGHGSGSYLMVSLTSNRATAEKLSRLPLTFNRSSMPRMPLPIRSKLSTTSQQTCMSF